ncbi:MAG: hypothetical protein ACOY94_23900 [Bacillota bacterium]
MASRWIRGSRLLLAGLVSISLLFGTVPVPIQAGVPAKQALDPDKVHPSLLAREKKAGGKVLGASSTAPPSYGTAVANSQDLEYISKVDIHFYPEKGFGNIFVDVVITSGAPGNYGLGEYVNAWLDFNGDGSFQSGEQILNWVRYASEVGYQGTLHYANSFDLPPGFRIETLGTMFSPMKGEKGEITVRVGNKDIDGWLRVNLGYAVDPEVVDTWGWGDVKDLPVHAEIFSDYDVAEVDYQIGKNGQGIGYVVASGSFEVPVDGAWHTFPVLEGAYPQLILPNGQYPVIMDFEFGGFWGIEQQVTSSIRVFDNPGHLVQVQETHVRNHVKAQVAKNHSIAPCLEGEGDNPCPEDLEELIYLTPIEHVPSVSVLTTVSDFVASAIPYGKVVEGLVGRMVSEWVERVAQSVTSQMTVAQVNEWLGDPNRVVDGSAIVLWSTDRRLWRPTVEDRGVLRHYDAPTFNVQLNNRHALVQYSFSPPLGMEMHNIQAGYLVDPWLTPWGGEETIGFVTNRDSLGEYFPEDTYVEPVTDLTTAVLDESGYKEMILEMYKANPLMWEYPKDSEPAPPPEPAPPLPPGTYSVPMNGSSGTTTGPVRLTLDPIDDPVWSIVDEDWDGDGLIDALLVSAPFTAEHEGEHTLMGTLYAPNGDAVALAEVTESLTPGSYAVPLRFDGTQIRLAGLDGPYSVGFAWLSPEAWGMSEEEFSTPGYSVNQFAALPITRTGPVQLSAVPAGGERTDLQAILNLHVEQAGPYIAGITLIDDEGEPVGSTSISVELEQGAQTVTLLVNGWELAGETPTKVSSYVWDPQAISERSIMGWEDPFPEMAPFPSKPAMLGADAPGVLGEDSTGDGRFDRMHVSVPVDGQASGSNYRLIATVENADGGVIDSKVVDGNGDSLTATFSGLLVNERAETPQLRATLLLVNEDGTVGWLDERVYPLDIDPARYGKALLATVTGAAGEEAIDADGNGLYESLNVAVVVEVTEAGPYLLSGDLVDQNGELIAKTSGSADLDEGTSHIYLQFPGDPIRLHRVDGPWQVRNLILLKQNDYRWPLADTLPEVSLTEAYAAADFEYQFALLNGSLKDEPIDSDGDGLYNQLSIQVGLDVAEAGAYRLDASIYSADGQFIERVVGMVTEFPSGTAQIDLLFDGTKLALHDGPYSLRSAQVFHNGALVDEHNWDLATAPYDRGQFQGGLADLYLSDGELTLVQHEPDGPVLVQATVRNMGGSVAHDVPLSMGIDDTVILESVLPMIGGTPVKVEGVWAPTDDALEVWVNVDPEGSVPDLNPYNQSSHLPMPAGFPSAPRHVTGLHTDEGVLIQWIQPEQAPDLVGYRVYRANEAGGPYTLLQDGVIVDGSYHDTTTEPGMIYHYRVAALAGTEPTLEGRWSDPLPMAPIEDPGIEILVTTDPSTPDGLAGWFVQPVNVTLAVGQPESVTSLEYRLNDGTWEEYIEPILLKESGLHQLEVRATGLDGNQVLTSQVIPVDLSRPQADFGDLKTVYTTGESLALALGAVDSLSGIKSVSATLDGEPVALDAVLTPSTGYHQLWLTVQDQAGNQTVSLRRFLLMHEVTVEDALADDPPVVVDILPVQFSARDVTGAFVHDETVRVVLWREGDTQPLASYTAGTPGIRIEDAGEVYLLDIDLLALGMEPGEAGWVDIYFADLRHHRTPFLVQ